MTFGRVSGNGSRVSGVECQISGFGFRVSGLGSQVSGVGRQVSDLGFRVSGLGSRVSGLEFEVSGLGFRVLGLGSRVSGLGFLVLLSRVSGFGLRDPGFGRTNSRDSRVSTCPRPLEARPPSHSARQRQQVTNPPSHSV